MNETNKIVVREQIDERLAEARARGLRIVFTNGCFDILHVGHARYLAQARALGDLLVVGLNSDSCVRRLKGDSRPIVPELERAELLAHLASVDLISLFDETLPNALIEVVRPTFHVKGADYNPEDLPETPVVRKYGGEVVILPLIEGKSTTNIVRRVVEVERG